MATTLLGRRFRIANLAAFAACGWLAAGAARDWVDARYAIVPGASGGQPVRVRPRAAAPRDKDGAALAARNMFCSECGQPPPGDPPRDPPGAGIPVTRLPLQLVATNLTSPRGWSFATIRDTSAEGRQGAYWIGDRVPGGGPIERIAGTEVVFASRDGGGRERLLLVPSRAGPAEPRLRPGAAAALADRIEQIDETTFAVDRSLVRDTVAGRDPGARAQPYASGEARGFKLYAVRPGSVAAALGLKNGDVIEAVDGTRLDSPDHLLEIYGRLNQVDSVSLTVRRSGRQATLHYRLR